MNELTQQDWLSIGEAAKLLRISKDTLRRWEKRGIIKAHRSPTNRRYYKKEELNYIFAKKPEIEEKISEAKPESGAPPPTQKQSQLPLFTTALLTVYIILMIFLAFLLLRAGQ